jgi:6,7-dimethyl-8-ribityllumazine synthase
VSERKVEAPRPWPQRDAMTQLADEPVAVPEEVPPPAEVPVPAETPAEAPSEAPAEAPVEAAAEPAPAEPEPAPAPVADLPSADHAGGVFRVPDGYAVLEGESEGRRRAVAVVVARFNRDITKAMLETALDALERAGVARDAITVMPVPGAFELPLATMALAKTRRYACIVALGCVIRGDTPHFDFVANEAASGLQLAALETGVPVAFGVLTTETREQAEARIERAGDAARTALEMADAFAQLRASAAAR